MNQPRRRLISAPARPYRSALYACALCTVRRCYTATPRSQIELRTLNLDVGCMPGRHVNCRHCVHAMRLPVPLRECDVETGRSGRAVPVESHARSPRRDHPS